MNFIFYVLGFAPLVILGICALSAFAKDQQKLDIPKDRYLEER